MALRPSVRRVTRMGLLAAGVAMLSVAALAQQGMTASEVRVQASAVIKKQLGKTSAGDSDCISSAINGARSQVDAAIAAANVRKAATPK